MDTSLDIGGGWKEAITLVSNLDLWCNLAVKVCGWTLGHRGPVDEKLLSTWNLPSGSSGEEALFHCGQEAQGFVRFIKLTNAGEPERIRAGAMPWDTGGIFSLMVRSKTLKSVFKTALDHGWTAVSDPLTFGYNDLVLSNVILRGPDGISFGVYERVDPPLTDWNHISRMSQPFNCMQIVRSRDATRDFHRDALGFTAFVDNDTRNTEPNDSNFGFPRNLTTEIETKAAIMHPRGIPGAKVRENGRVELIEWGGLDGRDLSKRASPPNLGHIGLRWVVNDIHATAKRITDAGYHLNTHPQSVTINPYGAMLMCSVKSPDGVLYELLQPSH